MWQLSVVQLGTKSITDIFHYLASLQPVSNNVESGFGLSVTTWFDLVDQKRNGNSMN